MRISRRSYSGDADAKRMRALVVRFPDGHIHLIDLPYRLSSWALDDPENVALWEDDRGLLRAWAVLQSPFWSLDFALDPAARADGIQHEVLVWAAERARAIVDQPDGHPCWFVSVRRDQPDWIADLVERADFRRLDQVAVDPWSKVLLRRTGNEPVADLTLPPGFHVRPLAGRAEVEAGVALHRLAFGTSNMTVPWRERILQQPEYVPDLDLVIQAPDGRLAAFCLAWLSPTDLVGRPAGQIEPLGVLPDFRRLGLGRAVLGEALRRLHAQGAEEVYVESDDGGAAIRLYREARFQPFQEIVVCRRDVDRGQ